MVVFPVHHYSRDQVIFDEGAIANVAYILKTGKIEISVRGKEGKLVLAHLNPGAIFGEMALLLKENKRTATAIALEDSEVVAIYKNFFIEYLKESPVVISTVLSGLVERLQDTTTRLLESERLLFKVEEILNLLVSHGVKYIKHDELVRTINHCFGLEPFTIGKKLEQFMELGHIQIIKDEMGKKVIQLPYKKI